MKYKVKICTDIDDNGNICYFLKYKRFLFWHVVYSTSTTYTIFYENEIEKRI